MIQFVSYNHHWRIKLEPLGRAHQPLAETAMVDDPLALEEVKIAGPAWPGFFLLPPAPPNDQTQQRRGLMMQ